jgi:hypothetical protein
MALVPVFCDSCGTLFAVDWLLGGAGDWSGVTLKDMRVGPCPVCNKAGRVLDGTYNLIGDTIQVLSAPEWSMEKLSWLANRINAARAGTVAPEQVADEITKDAPEIAALMSKLMRGGWKLLQVFAVLFAVIGYIQGDLSADVAAIDHAVQSVVDELQSHPIPAAPQRSPGVRAARTSRTNTPRSGTSKRKAKRGKTYGQQKRRKRR